MLYSVVDYKTLFSIILNLSTLIIYKFKSLTTYLLPLPMQNINQTLMEPKIGGSVQH